MQYFHVYLIQVENDYKRQRSQPGPGSVQKGNEASLPKIHHPQNIETVCTCN